jgi:nitrate reductase gamma subunit
MEPANTMEALTQNVRVFREIAIMRSAMIGALILFGLALVILRGWWKGRS